MEHEPNLKHVFYSNVYLKLIISNNNYIKETRLKHFLKLYFHDPPSNQ